MFSKKRLLVLIVIFFLQGLKFKQNNFIKQNYGYLSKAILLKYVRFDKKRQKCFIKNFFSSNCFVLLNLTKYLFCL